MSDARWFAEAQKVKQTGDFCAARGDWRGAYRNYGCAAEFAMKAIYLRNTQQKDMPPHMRTATSHDLKWLACAAGLSQEVATFIGARRINWLVVRDWDQGKRYPNEAFPAREGKDFKAAFLNPSNGIWPWLLNHYQSN